MFWKPNHLKGFVFSHRSLSRRATNRGYHTQGPQNRYSEMTMVMYCCSAVESTGEIDVSKELYVISW